MVQNVFAVPSSPPDQLKAKVTERSFVLKFLLTSLFADPTTEWVHALMLIHAGPIFAQYHPSLG